MRSLASYQNIYNKFQSFFYIFWPSTHYNRFNITAKQIAGTKKLNDLNQKLSLLDRYHASLIKNIAMFKAHKKDLKIGTDSSKSIIYNNDIKRSIFGLSLTRFE